jgi:hypothetical protein
MLVEGGETTEDVALLCCREEPGAGAVVWNVAARGRRRGGERRGRVQMKRRRGQGCGA